MRAVTIKDQNLSVEDHPDPAPGAGEVLVRVKAAGLNGADMMQRRGFYPAPPGAPPDIPGLELAGEVVGRGPGRRPVRGRRPGHGDRGRRWPGRAGGRARADPDGGSRQPRLGAGRRRPRDVHDRPRRRLHPGGAEGRRAAARPRWRRRRRNRGDPARRAPPGRGSPPPSATPTTGTRWRSSAPR